MITNEDLLRELKHIKALLAMSFVRDYETKTEKIIFLNRFGFETTDIAELIGTTPGTVSVAISQAKGKKKKTVTKIKTKSAGGGSDGEPEA
jgi:DNA-directed RNA polymerase specialized sigma24 family protein